MEQKRDIREIVKIKKADSLSIWNDIEKIGEANEPNEKTVL